MSKNFVADDRHADTNIRVRKFVADDHAGDTNIRVRKARRFSQSFIRNIAYSVMAVLGLAVGLVGTLNFGNAAGATEDAPLIIDVRTAEEFAAGHLEGAINIPLDADPEEFRAQIDALDRAGDFVLHCGTGARADRVAAFMADQGFTGLIASYSLEEAVSFLGANVIGDLFAANDVNPTVNPDAADGPRTCAITGDDLFGITRP